MLVYDQLLLHDMMENEPLFIIKFHIYYCIILGPLLLFMYEVSSLNFGILLQKIVLYHIFTSYL